VNGASGFPMLQFVECHSEIFEDLAAYEFDSTLGVHDGDQPGNGVENQAKGLFAYAEGVRARPVFQVDIRSVPFDLAGFVQHRIATDEEAAVFTVDPSKARIHIKRPSGVQGISENFQQFGEIAGVDRNRPSPTRNHFRSETCIVQPAPVIRIRRNRPAMRTMPTLGSSR
jgi:hypothetical protein